MGVGFAFGGEAEGDGHDFCFAEEESGGFGQSAGGCRWGRGAGTEGGGVTCCPIVASGRL